MNTTYLQNLRRTELNASLASLPPRGRLLELGAGAGWQARILQQEYRYDVVAVDIPDSSYVAHRVFPVLEFDGWRLPFASGSFDIVFSSNVLEHVERFADLQREVIRVLAPGGVAVHVVPATPWQLWNLLLHYPALAKKALVRALVANAASAAGDSSHPRLDHVGAHGRTPRRWWHSLIPWPHGMRGNALVELITYSQHAWRRDFEAAGLEVIERRPTRLCYSGHAFFGSSLSLAARKRLSYLLGSACHVFVLRGAHRK